MNTIRYLPPGPVASSFLRSSARRRVIMGPFGSGKSVACCVEVMRRAREQAPGADGVRRTRWAIVRNTYPDLKNTTVKTWRDWWGDAFGRFRRVAPFVHHLKFALDDGTRVDCEVIFLAMNNEADAKKFLSLELTGLYFNEVRELKRSVVEAGDGRLGRYPAMKDGGPTWYGMIADAVVAWTNYATGNIGQAARLKLTGALVSGAVLTFPAYQNFLSIENAAGAAVTIKCAGGTGVVLANGQTVDLYCDGTDYKNAGPTRLGLGDVTVAGKVSGLTAGAAATDAVNKTQMETAIATAGLPATAGTMLVSSGDTTAGYMSQKIAVAGDLAVSIQNAGGDEDVLVTHAPYWSASRVVADADSPVTALDRDVLLVRTSTGAVEINLPSEGRVKIVDVDGAASANNIAVDPPDGDTIGFDVVDTDYFEGIWQRRPGGTNWDLI